MLLLLLKCLLALFRGKPVLFLLLTKSLGHGAAGILRNGFSRLSGGAIRHFLATLLGFSLGLFLRFLKCLLTLFRRKTVLLLLLTKTLGHSAARLFGGWVGAAIGLAICEFLATRVGVEFGLLLFFAEFLLTFFQSETVLFLLFADLLLGAP